MKVLYISNRPHINATEALTWFKPYCEHTDLILKTHISDAKEFLSKEILGNQKHLDFVITDWQFHFENPKTLLEWIRNSTDTYSAKNFQFSSLPVLLIEDQAQQSTTISTGFSEVVKEFPTDSLKLKLAIKSAVKAWRYDLANDLDLIGLDPKTQRVYPIHRSSFISYYRLKVLSRQFVDSKSKRLNYIWTNSDLQNLNDSNEAFHSKMIRTFRNPPKYLEKEFHDFFRANPTFIKGEDFMSTAETMLYEKHLYKGNTRKYDEPDFLNKPHEYALRFPEVFEIKRQSQRLLRRDTDKFISKARKSFEQVKRYKEYVTSTDPNNQAYIKRYFGQVHTNYEYTLLMGSKSEKEANEDLIDRLKQDFDFDDINLLTYEELLERHVRLCNRLSEFNIFDDSWGS